MRPSIRTLLSRRAAVRQLPILMLLLAVITNVEGSGNGNGSSGDGNSGARDTAWTDPFGLNASAECVWTVAVHEGNHDEPSPDDPAPDGPPPLGSDAYAAAIADGMQIWGYAWAKTSSATTVGVASSAGSAGGYGTITKVFVKPGCVSYMACDWKPRFRVRANMFDDSGSYGGAGYMKGDCDELHCHVLAKGGAEIVSAEGQESDFQLTLGPVTVSMTRFTGAVAREFTYIDNDHKAQACDTATAYWSSAVSVYATASGGIFDDYAEGQANVWDSVPGLDLHANCPPNCTGAATVLYGWYN